MDSSDTWPSPSRSTMAAAPSPDAHIFSNTSRPVVPLMAPASIMRTRSARAAGVTGHEASGRSSSFSFRSTAVITQLDAALGLPLPRATAS